MAQSKVAVFLLEAKMRVTAEEASEIREFLQEFFDDRQDSLQVEEFLGSGRCWIDQRKFMSVTVEDGEPPARNRTDAAEQVVITLLTDNGAPMLRNDIINACKGFTFATVVRALCGLKRHGKIVRKQRGKQAFFAIASSDVAWWGAAEAEKQFKPVED